MRFFALCKFLAIFFISAIFWANLANANFGKCKFFPEPKVTLGKKPLYLFKGFLIWYLP